MHPSVMSAPAEQALASSSGGYEPAEQPLAASHDWASVEAEGSPPELPLVKTESASSFLSCGDDHSPAKVSGQDAKVSGSPAKLSGQDNVSSAKVSGQDAKVSDSSAKCSGQD